VLTTVEVGHEPHGLAFDSAMKEVFVAVHGDSTVAAISDVSNTVVALVSIVRTGGTPYAVAYDSGKGEVFVTNGLDPTVQSATVSIIADTISGTTTTTTTTTTHTTPTTTTHPTSTVACTPSTTAPGATSAGVGPWAPTNCYPTVIDSQSCPTSGGYIYCVGGFDSVGPTSSVYFAPVTSSGVGAWKSTTAYPTPVGGESCDIAGGYLYCVGGITSSGAAGDAYTNEAFLAPVNSTGVGEWHTTIGYPTYIYDQSCAISGGYIYCVGGNNRIRDSATSALAVSDAVFYAPISTGGIGGWVETTNYPLFDESVSCGASGGFLYCVGGFTVNRTVDSSGTTYVPGITGAVYFAPVTADGVGAWSSTTSYPTAIYAQTCDFSGGSYYCVGGDTNAVGESATSAVYYAPVSSTGVGTWASTTAYPANMQSLTCSASGGFIYCVGGFNSASVSTNEVCYAQLGIQAPPLRPRRRRQPALR
jgi:hypothetical protein